MALGLPALLLACAGSEPDPGAARGYGGQDCFVLEDLEVVVVFTGGAGRAVEMARDVTTVMNDFVLPAAAID